jgi:hypothetical protein
MFEVFLLLAAALVGDSGGSAYSQRDGVAEARKVARSGAVQLYSHVRNGRAPGFATPGLRHCDPRDAGGLNRIVFLPLPEADWGEGTHYPPEGYARASEAVQFARAYNREMFKLKARAIRRVCPRVELES